MVGEKKPLFSLPSVHKHCLFILFLQSETLAMKIYFDQCADRSPSGPRVEFLRADMRIKVLDIIYLKIWKSLRTWDHSWQPPKRNRIGYCVPSVQKHGQSSQSPAEGHRKKSDPGKLLKGDEEKKNLSSSLTPACTKTSRNKKGNSTQWHSNITAVDSHRERRKGPSGGGAKWRLQVPGFILVLRDCE